MRFAPIILIWHLLLPAAAVEADKELERLEKSRTVLEEVLGMPDSLPLDLLDRAECVVIMPSVKKFALGFGAKYGRGVMVCRGGAEFEGAWGAPAMYRLEGGNIGFQIGGQATDFILLVMTGPGASSLLQSKVKLGADASVAAGPKGRASEAATDIALEAEILSYSRSKGLFAGVSLEGSSLRPDDKGNEALYGSELKATDIVRGDRSVPEGASALVSLLREVSPENLSQ